MNIGTIKIVEGQLIGELLTLEKHLKFALLDNANYDERNENSPKHTIVAKGAHGKYVEVGSAWRKTSDRGLQYLTLSFDAPEWETGINASAFMRKNSNDTMDLVYSRPKARVVSNDQEKDMAQAA